MVVTAVARERMMLVQKIKEEIAHKAKVKNFVMTRTIAQLVEEFNDLAPGQYVIYHTGYLPIDAETNRNVRDKSLVFRTLATPKRDDVYLHIDGGEKRPTWPSASRLKGMGLGHAVQVRLVAKRGIGIFEYRLIKSARLIR